MATINVKDAAGATVAIEKPLAPGRAGEGASRPVVLSDEDKAALDAVTAALGGVATDAGLAAIVAKLSDDPATQTTLAAVLAKLSSDPSTGGKQDAAKAVLDSILAKLIAAPATEVKQDSAIAATTRLAPPTLGVSSDVAFTDTSAQSGALTGTMIRVIARGADCRIAIGANPTAVATGTLIAAGVPEYFAVTSGHKVAAIRDAGVSGTLNITVVG